MLEFIIIGAIIGAGFASGKEIIDYLNQKYIEYYRVYLDLMEDKVNEENYENSKVPLSY